MWNDLNREVEELVGDVNINYQDWLELLTGVDAELFVQQQRPILSVTILGVTILGVTILIDTAAKRSVVGCSLYDLLKKHNQIFNLSCPLG